MMRRQVDEGGGRVPVRRVESTVTVARPPEDVYAFFLDFDKYGEERVESVVKEPEGPTSEGTVFRFDHGKGRETTMRFTSLEPNRKIGFDGDVLGPFRPVGAFSIEPTEGGSTLTIRVVPNPVGVLTVASPVINLVGSRIWAKRLAQIKAAIER
jgi:uncharacterized protein YndB with AHSA1/START domain